MYNNIIGSKVSQLVAGLGVGYAVLTGAASVEASSLDQQQTENNQPSKIINNVEMGNFGGGMLSDNFVVKLDGSGSLVVSDMDTSRAEILSNPEVMKVMLTKDSFSNMQSAKDDIMQVCERLGIKDTQKVFDSMYNMNMALKSEIDNHLNKYGSNERRFKAARAGVENLSGEGNVYYPLMCMKGAPGNENTTAFRKSPNQLEHIEDYVYNNKNNQAYAGFCLQHKYIMEGKDSLELVMSKERAEAFHDKFGELNRVNALFVPFYADASDKNLETVSRDGCDARMTTAADRRFKDDGMCKYDRGADSKMNYTLDVNDVKAISYYYGMGTVTELQNLKPYFFDKGATQYIEQCKNVQSLFMGKVLADNNTASLTDNHQSISDQHNLGEEKVVTNDWKYGAFGGSEAKESDKDWTDFLRNPVGSDSPSVSPVHEPLGMESHSYVDYGNGKGSESYEFEFKYFKEVNKDGVQDYVKKAVEGFLNDANRLGKDTGIKIKHADFDKEAKSIYIVAEVDNVLPPKEVIESHKDILKEIPKGKVFEPFNMKDVIGQTEEFNKSVEALAAAKVDEKVAGVKLKEHMNTYTNENGGMLDSIKSRIAIMRDFGSVDKMNAETNRLSGKAAETVQATSAAGKNFDEKISELRSTVESKCGGDKSVMDAFDQFASNANAFKYAVSEGYQKLTREAMGRMQDSYQKFGVKLSDFGKAQDKANIDKEKSTRMKVIELSSGTPNPSMGPAEFYCTSVNKFINQEGNSVADAEKLATKSLVKVYGASVAEPVVMANAGGGIEGKGAKALINKAVKSIEEDQKASKVEKQIDQSKAKSAVKTKDIARNKSDEFIH